MAGRAEHKADKQPGGRKRATRAGGSKEDGDATSPSRASISELQRAEDALREREQMISGLLESLPGTAYRSELYAPWHVSFLSEGFRSAARSRPHGVHGWRPDLGRLRASRRPREDRGRAGPRPRRRVRRHRVRVPHDHRRRRDALGARQGRVRAGRGRPTGGDDRPPDRRHRPARGAGRAGRERTPPAHHHRQHPRHGVPLAGGRAVERRAHRRRRRERHRLLRRGAHGPGLPLGRHHGARGRAAAGRGHEGRGRRRSRRRRVPHPHQGRR